MVKAPLFSAMGESTWVSTRTGSATGMARYTARMARHCNQEFGRAVFLLAVTERRRRPYRDWTGRPERRNLERI